MGGLLLESYLQQTTIENMGNVVVLGSAHKGTPLVDRFKDRWWYPFVAPPR